MIVNPLGGSSRMRSNLVLIGLVAVFLVFNTATALLFTGSSNSEWLEAMGLGALVFQPIAIGMWAALGGGSTLLNVPLAAPCLMLLIVAAGFDRNGYSDMQPREFVAFAITGFAIFGLATILFLAVWRLIKLRIVHIASMPDSRTPSVHFSIKFLLALTTLWALVLAIIMQLDFQKEPPPPSLIFGPNFFIHILAVGGATFSAVVLPTLAVPLSILYGGAFKRVLRNAVFFWAVVTFLVVSIWAALEEEWLNIFAIILLVQSGAAITGAISALMLRFGGFRLVRLQSPAPSP